MAPPAKKKVFTARNLSREDGRTGPENEKANGSHVKVSEKRKEKLNFMGFHRRKGKDVKVRCGRRTRRTLT